MCALAFLDHKHQKLVVSSIIFILSSQQTWYCNFYWNSYWFEFICIFRIFLAIWEVKYYLKGSNYNYFVSWMFYNFIGKNLLFNPQITDPESSPSVVSLLAAEPTYNPGSLILLLSFSAHRKPYKRTASLER